MSARWNGLDLGRVCGAVVLLLGSVGVAGGAFAAEFVVSNAAELTQRLGQAGPGDTILLADGVWEDQYLRFNGDGAAGQPLTLKAQTPGGVVLTGSSRLEISGDHLHVEGLRFENGALSENQHVVRFRGSNGDATNSRLTNSTIIDYNPNDAATRYFWVSLHGDNNRVDHNTFSGQNHSGVTVTVWRDGGVDSHLIDRNIFADRPDGGGNGFETIRIGTSDDSLSDSRTVVENNLFHATDGETEIISVKSGDNDIRYNTFLEAAGTVTLRHGNGNRVNGNFFLGEGKNESGGIRVIGPDQVVTNNYLADLDGRAGGGIVLTAGQVGNALNGYQPVTDAVIAHNTLVNISDAAIKLDDGFGSRDRVLLPEDVTLANNLIQSGGGPSFEGQEGAGWTWESNLAFGGALGVTARPGITQADPKLVLGADGLYRPAADSPAIDAAAAGYTTVDMDGQARVGLNDIGADEVSEAAIVRKPLTRDDVGADFDGGPVDPPSEDPYRAIQAEDFSQLLDPNGDGDTWVTVATDGALGGEALKAPPGSRTDANTEMQDALATYDLVFTQPGSYVAYYRARGFSSGSDSLYAPDAFGANPTLIESLTPNGDWRWEEGQVFEIGTSDVGVPLELRLGRREKDAELDAVVLHTLAGLSASDLDALFGLLGDFDASGSRDADDLDALFAAFGGDALATFDLNDDAAIDLDDALFWVQEIRQTSLADLDLDGDVDAADAAILVAHYTGEATSLFPRRWSEGDLNGDGAVDFDDAMTLSRMFDDDAAVAGLTALAVLPEPAVAGGVTMLALLLRWRP